MISMIAAIGMNRELGEGPNLIWKIPNDLARFREKTSGHSVIMGRKTFESIGRLLPNRTNIIVTREQGYKVEGAIICSSIEDAIEKAKAAPGGDEVFIIGGGQIYDGSLKYADKLYLTLINSQAPMADVFFPEYSAFTKEVFREKHEEDGLEYEFVDLVK